MDNDKTKIDISSVDAAKLPHKDRLTEFKKTWYKFSLNKMSVVGLVIIILVILLAVFYKFIVPYPEDIGAVVKFQEALQAPSAEHLLELTLQEEICSAESYTHSRSPDHGRGMSDNSCAFRRHTGTCSRILEREIHIQFHNESIRCIFGSAGADTGNVRFIHNGTQHDQRHVGSQCFLVALVYEAGIRHSGFHTKRNIYTICGSPRSQQKSHTVQRNTAKHLVAYSDKSNFGYGLGNHGRSYPELRGNGRTAADSVSWGYGLKRSKLLAGPVVDVGIPGSGDHDNSAGL